MGVNEEMLELAKREITSESTQPPVSGVISDALRHLKVLDSAPARRVLASARTWQNLELLTKKILGQEKTEIAQLQVEGVI